MFPTPDQLTPCLTLLAEAGVASQPVRMSMIEHPAGILAALLGVLAVIFWATQHPVIGRLFKVVPALVFCYFVPTALTTMGVLPSESGLYTWIKAFVLPAALLLLILSLDLPGIIRLGPKAVIMLLTGTASIVVGGPVALLICQHWLPEDAWKGLTALAGSWIGGGANFVALGDIAGASDKMMGLMVIPDVFVASIWMAVLLYLSGHQHRIDRATGANAQAIRDLEVRLTNFQARVNRVATLPDLMMIVGLGFVASWISYAVGKEVFAGTSVVVREVAAGALAQPGVFAEMALGDVRHMIDAALENDVSALAVLSAQQAAEYRFCQFFSLDVIPGGGEWIFVAQEELVRGVATGLYATSETVKSMDVLDVVHGIDLAVRENSAALAQVPAAQGWWYPVGRFLCTSLGASTWKYIFVTTIGIVLSLTRARNLEGAGASKIGSVLLYLLVACIGAGADFTEIVKHPAFFVTGFIWISIHVAVMLTVGYLIKAPIFFVAVGSQSNIGGAASAPVVAAAYHPSLAPVGALLAVAGYVLGTYAGLICMHMLKAVAGVE
ncbi:MAG: DUF819 family protein [Planctomycetota bacterium]